METIARIYPGYKCVSHDVYKCRIKTELNRIKTITDAECIHKIHKKLHFNTSALQIHIKQLQNSYST